MGFDIIKATNNITSKYTRYLNTMFDIADPVYKHLLTEKMAEQQSFSKGPYLEVVDSFETGSEVKTLIKDGILHPDFQYVRDIYVKTLYRHQELSVRKLQSGRNVVVSTGTGSGKTESFIIPILDSLMRERESCGKLSPGVRALLVYPMNALANDQIDRLRSLLEEYPFITFGSYTGQTREKEKEAVEKYKSLHGGKKPLKNELISRERMKESPPHILITNYSMLEYLMLRPEDNELFQGQYSGSWKFIVLDEAHTYAGSTGIEVSMLLRRLKGFLPKSELRYILTSATLGGEKSNKEVAEFAQTLCNALFSEDDIIRASRIRLIQNRVNGIELQTQDYLELKDILDSGYAEKETIVLMEKHLGIERAEGTEDLSEYLYDVLLRDNTYWRVKKYLSTPKTVKEICAAFRWTEREVAAFVDVASNAVKNRKKLFDSRYHMFLRATEGVFVTLGEQKELSLVRKEYTDNREYRFFEIVTCSQCQAIYLFGSIEAHGQLKYLRQRSNRGGSDIKEAFYVGKPLDEKDDDTEASDEKQSVSAFELCPRCGFIRERDQVHKVSCAHNPSGYIQLTRVKHSERTGRVTKCVCCGGVNNMGVLRSFFSGQEASTSVIGTALFEELPDKVLSRVEQKKEDELFDDEFGGFDAAPVAVSYEPKAKQFIAFSDSRQAAAFFATYFYETYQGFLYSRIVYDNVKQTDEEGKSLVNFARDMTAEFRSHKVAEMFDEHPDYQKEAWKAVLKELINSYSRNSLIGLGLMRVDLDESARLGGLQKLGLTEREVRDICLVCLRSLFEDNAIYHGQNFTDADVAFYSNNGAEHYYVSANPENRYIRSFIPKTDSSTNKRFDYIERVFEAKGIEHDREKIIRFMSQLWNGLERKGVFKDNADYSGKQADVRKLKVVNTKHWYRCSKCHRITSYNVADVCPAYRCDGFLEKIDVATLEDKNHYYRIYNDLDIRPLRVVEHTAQLSNERAYALQDQFKNQKIDVLSCSTTFEMGVDIGDLETVFMRNMPPSPSNYVQRAGRAGRSLKSAALALTFCNKSNHDFSYFEEPVSMIKGRIEPPHFKVENEKIGIRHLYAVALSFFWKKEPRYFGKISGFFGEEFETDGFERFQQYLEGKPEELKLYLLSVFPPILIEKYEINDFGWTRWLFDEPVSMYPNLKSVYEQYREEICSLYEEKKKLEDNNQPNGMLLRRINTYAGENVISFLSRSNILPKYGFPVDTVELQINSRGKKEPLDIELSRDLSMAISEYAPGCEVVASGNLIRSRYIRLVPNKNWRLYDYIQCPTCGTLNMEIHHEVKSDTELSFCKQCGDAFKRNDIRTFLIPEFGFLSEPKVERPSLIKPDKTYRTDASIVNRGTEVLEGDYQIGALRVQTVSVEDGEIAILNKSDFYVCKSCGYALGDFEADAYSNSLVKKHKNYSGYNCKCERLERFNLGYRFKTDAVCISLNIMMGHDEAYSVLQAIILSACKCLNIDNGEISGCLQYVVKSCGPTYDFIIYDTTPGGAGHVRRFSTERAMREVLVGAYMKAKNCTCGGQEGDTSCYNCLRTYQNQHSHDILKRRYVMDILEALTTSGATTTASESVLKKKKTIVPHKKIAFSSMCDTSIHDESYEYIVSSLDLDSDEGEMRVAELMRQEEIDKPDCCDTDFFVDGSDTVTGYADLVWRARKVLVFRPDNRDSYEAALGCDYSCYIFEPGFDPEELIQMLK